MTVASTLNRKTFTGNGSTTSFALSPVTFFQSSDLTVYVVTTATGASTTLVENTDYIVDSPIPFDGTGTIDTTGGSSPYGAPSALQTLVVVRAVPLTQETDFVNNDASDAEVAEAALDKLTMADQQIAAQVARSFKLADSDISGADLTLPTPDGTKFFAWNTAGDAVEYVGGTDGTGGSLHVLLLSTAGAAQIGIADAGTLITAITVEGALAEAFTAIATKANDSAVAKLAVEDQALTGGVIVTSKNLGTVSSGTLTPDPGDRPMQHCTNNGAHTLAPSSNTGSLLLDITNGASAGAITTSGFTYVAGDAFTTTNGHKFRCHISIGNAGSLLSVQALQ